MRGYQTDPAADAWHSTQELPGAIQAAAPEVMEQFALHASAGQGGWAHTSWLAVLDPAVTTTVQDGLYAVYLLSTDGKHLFLTLNQGCTTLKDAVGIPAAREELRRRAALMRGRIQNTAVRLRADDIALNSRLWRARLYEAGNVMSVKYDALNLPAEPELVADLREALHLYRLIRIGGAWTAEDDILEDAKADGLDEAISIEQAKRYRQHKHIERHPGHARIVKRLLGTRCMGCDQEMAEIYGSLAQGLIHAHHLAPLATLELDQKIKLDPKRDFAVLCPNCHAVIHRMQDVSDLPGLRAMIAFTQANSLSAIPVVDNDPLNRLSENM